MTAASEAGVDVAAKVDEAADQFERVLGTSPNGVPVRCKVSLTADDLKQLRAAAKALREMSEALAAADRLALHSRHLLKSVTDIPNVAGEMRPIEATLLWNIHSMLGIYSDKRPTPPLAAAVAAGER